MGANAQTSVPTFTAGEILTAANMNISARTGITDFADSTARDAAFGGTGEKTLAEGQYAYLEDSNTTQYYDGSAWQTVGINPGLVCIKAETAFSAVTTVTLDDIFTSSYTNYRLMVRYTTSTTNAASLQLRAAGSTASGANYNQGVLYQDGATASGFTQNSQTSWVNLLVSSSTFNNSIFIDLFATQLATPTLANSSTNVNLGAYTSNRVYTGALNHTLATAYDGFILSVTTGTFSGTYSVFGYAKTV